MLRRHGWKKLYIVVSSRKIIFFNSEVDRQNSDPSLILDLSKVSNLISKLLYRGFKQCFKSGSALKRCSGSESALEMRIPDQDPAAIK